LNLNRYQRDPSGSLCSSDNSDNSDGGIGTGGIDALGQYDSAEVVVRLDLCQIAKACATHGFNREDAIKVVLIHELAHFVTLVGTNSGALQGGSPDEKDYTEDVAQEATHLLLRVAGYGHLVQVFDALSQLCPPIYDSWRTTWGKDQLKRGASLDSILSDFRAKLQVLRQKPISRDRSIDIDDY
jgi:hypothetical protein